MQRAIGMVEFSSIARGIYAADQMVKVSEVEVVTASTSCPGKYVAIVHGDVAAVKTSIETGEREAGEYYIDSMVIPNVHYRSHLHRRDQCPGNHGVVFHCCYAGNRRCDS